MASQIGRMANKGTTRTRTAGQAWQGRARAGLVRLTPSKQPQRTTQDLGPPRGPEGSQGPPDP